MCVVVKVVEKARCAIEAAYYDKLKGDLPVMQ